MLLIFNRPDLTKIVFDQIKKARPERLFVAADGPRKNKSGEAEKCSQARQAVLKHINWKCEVQVLLREENLGCKKAVSSAIDWFFSSVDKGIILEDDCLPSLSFFEFCTQLLTYYEHSDQVMHISGNNFQKENVAGNDSYYFSVYNHIWGWATWRRAWQAYDVHISEYDPEVMKRTLQRKSEQKYWQECFTKVASGQVDTWDYQWTYAIWKGGGLCVLPSVNLVSNIGFGEGATHTTAKNSTAANLPTQTIGRLVHPREIRVNRKADQYTSVKFFIGHNGAQRKRDKLKRFIISKLPFSFGRDGNHST